MSPRTHTVSTLLLATGLLAVAHPTLAEEAVFSARFRRGRLVEGGPVVFRGRRARLPQEGPSVGAWVTAPGRGSLGELVVEARAAGAAGALQLRVDRRRVGEPLEVTNRALGEFRFPLHLPRGARGYRLEVEALRGGIQISALRVLAGRPTEGAGAVRVAEASPGRDLRSLLPLEAGRRFEFLDAAGEPVSLVSRGEISTRGARRIRLEREGSDSYFLFTPEPVLAMSAYRSPEGTLARLADAPILLGLGGRVLVGDEYESAGSRRGLAEVLPPEDGGRGLRWRLRAEGAGPTLDAILAASPGRGPTALTGQLFGDVVDWSRGHLPPLSPDPGPTSQAEQLRHWDGWLAARGLDEFGRKVGSVPGGTIKVHKSPDLGGRTRLQWLQQFFEGSSPPAVLR